MRSCVGPVLQIGFFDVNLLRSDGLLKLEHLRRVRLDRSERGGWRWRSGDGLRYRNDLAGHLGGFIAASQQLRKPRRELRQRHRDGNRIHHTIPTVPVAVFQQFSQRSGCGLPGRQALTYWSQPSAASAGNLLGKVNTNSRAATAAITSLYRIASHNANGSALMLYASHIFVM